MSAALQATRLVPLWPHQDAALLATHAAIGAGRPSGLIVLPTGAGKTVTFVTLAVDLGWPTLVLVHRDELVRQTLATARRVWPGVRLGVIQAERDEWRCGEQIVVASVQSLHARRLAQMPHDRFGLLVVDEAHHTAADTYGRILSHFAGRNFLLGVTATPERLDGVGLCHWYGEQPLFTYSIRQAVKDGILVAPVQRQVQTRINLDKVHTRGGDFAEGELADAVNTPARNKAIVEAFTEHASKRKAVAFCVDVQHARDLADAFDAAGVRAMTVTGELPTLERRRLLDGLAAGSFQVATCCQVLVEGFDEPTLDAVVMARPTASRSLYIQCVGRGLRRCEVTGKKDCLVLDVTDNCRKHKLVSATSLLDELREENASPEGGEEDKGGLRQDAGEMDARPVTWRLEEVSPWPEMPDLTGYEAKFVWHGEPASPGQVRYLRSFGLEVERDLTKGEASHLIEIATRLDEEFPTPPSSAQRGLLLRAGLWHDGMTKREAGRLIAQVRGGAQKGGRR